MKDAFVRFNHDQFNKIFPFYILIDQNMFVNSIGKTLDKLFPGTRDTYFGDHYSILRPHLKETTFDSIQTIMNQMIVIECHNEQKTSLRGQIEYLADTKKLLFIGSPWFGSMEQVIANNLSLHDFAWHDPMIDLLHVLKTQEITTEDLKEVIMKVNQQKNDLKKASQELQDIALFPTQNPDPLIRIDFDGHILALNPAAEKLTDFVYQDERYQPADFWKQVVGAFNKDADRIGLEAQSGNRIFSFVIKPLPDNGYFNIYGRDITGQKENEEQLRILSSIAAENTHGVVIADREGKIEWVNKSFENMTGYTLGELAGQKPGHVLQGEGTDPETIQYLKNQIYHGEPFVCEILNYHKSGKPYWLRVQGQALKDNEGKLFKYFAIEEDITEEKETQKKLKEFESRFRIALEKIGDNVWEHDYRSGETVFSNPNNTFLGLDVTNPAANNKLWWDHVHEDDRSLLQENDEKCRKGETDFHTLEYRMRSEQGDIKWVLDRGVVIEKDNRGKPLKMIGTHTDITKQKTLELDLIRAKNSAEESTRAKEVFLANMSHEIRTPMNAIIGMSNQLSKTSLGNEQRFYLETIHSAADSLLVIINDILDLSKIEAGKLSLEKIGFELNESTSRVIQTMQHKAEEKGLTFSVTHFDKNISPILIGDPYRINQVLMNLTSNAIKFTEKGSVSIACDLISETADQQEIQITVKDTGIGMDKNFLKNLYQKFSQEDESITRRYGGTGLGTSISKELIELMNGSINVESEKGKGTSVIISMNLIKGTESDLPVKDDFVPEKNTLADKNILVVDDNAMNRLVATTILSQYNASYDTAADGLEAIEKIRSKTFDLVLMDVQMPVMDGIEATRTIRKEISTELPIIALTAFALKGDDQKFLDAGMNDYLSKPFEENQFIRIIAQWLGKKLVPAKPNLEDKPVEALFDLTKLESIVPDNPDFANQMVELFIDQAKKTLSEIHEAYTTGDYTLISKLAHRIKPSIDNMGIASLKDPIREIESRATEYQESEKLNTLINTLEEVLMNVIDQLNKR